jgi:hypothetical protein
MVRYSGDYGCDSYQTQVTRLQYMAIAFKASMAKNTGNETPEIKESGEMAVQGIVGLSKSNCRPLSGDYVDVLLLGVISRLLEQGISTQISNKTPRPKAVNVFQTIASFCIECASSDVQPNGATSVYTSSPAIPLMRQYQNFCYREETRQNQKNSILCAECAAKYAWIQPMTGGC